MSNNLLFFLGDKLFNFIHKNDLKSKRNLDSSCADMSLVYIKCIKTNNRSHAKLFIERCHHQTVIINSKKSRIFILILRAAIKFHAHLIFLFYLFSYQLRFYSFHSAFHIPRIFKKKSDVFYFCLIYFHVILFIFLFFSDVSWTDVVCTRKFSTS